MKEVINQIIDKFSPYQLFCNLFPGFLVVRGFCYVTSTTLVTENICETLGVIYFYGVAVSRVASIIVEPVLKRLFKIQFAPYSEYLEALRQDISLADLMREANMFRILLTVVLILLFIFLLNLIPFVQKRWCSSCFFVISQVIVFIPVFACSYRKQCVFVVERIEKILRKEEK